LNLECFSQELNETEDSDDEDEELCIGFYMAHTSQMKRKKLSLWEGDILAKSRWESRRTVFVEAILEGKETPTIIVPATYDADELGRYSLMVYANEDVELEKIGEEGDSWHTESILGRWEGISAGGDKSHATWKNNTQYQVVMPPLEEGEDDSGNMEIMVVVTQLNRDYDDYLAEIGFYILYGDDPSKKNLKINKECLLKTSRFDAAYEVTMRTHLPKNAKHPYIIVPVSSEPGIERDFELKVFSEGKSKLRAIKDRDDWEMAACSGQWLHGSAGGGVHQSLWRMNQQLFMKLERRNKMIIFLTRTLTLTMTLTLTLTLTLNLTLILILTLTMTLTLTPTLTGGAPRCTSSSDRNLSRKEQSWVP